MAGKLVLSFSFFFPFDTVVCRIVNEGDALRVTFSPFPESDSCPVQSDYVFLNEVYFTQVLYIKKFVILEIHCVK